MPVLIAVAVASLLGIPAGNTLPKVILTDGVNRVALVVPSDLAGLKRQLARLSNRFSQDAQSAEIVEGPRGAPKVLPGLYARRLNVATTAARLQAALAADPALKSFSVSLDKTPPELTPEKLQGITGTLARYSTRTSAQTKRNKNIALAVSSIHGTLLAPGETFSLNQVVGKRTQSRGYRTATVFVNAEKVPGVGGGVSQVTGTLFNAAALANLKIVEVHPHSRPVAYLPVGRDATVAYGDKDLKFTNTTTGPVYVQYRFENRNLAARLWGIKPNDQKVVLTARSQNLAPGSVKAQLYRTVKQKGQVVHKEQLLSHHYLWKP